MAISPTLRSPWNHGEQSECCIFTSRFTILHDQELPLQIRLTTEKLKERCVFYTGMVRSQLRTRAAEWVLAQACQFIVTSA